MAGFEPIQNVPVQRVDTIVEIVSRGDGTHSSDDVFVTTNLSLTADIDSSEEALLILPLASEAQQQPLVRYTGEPINGPAVFAFDPTERSELDDELIERLVAMANGASKKEQKAFATQVSRAASAFSTTVVKVEPGQRRLRLFYSVSADKAADREFEFTVIGPLPSFVIGTGGSIQLTALLHRGTSLVSAQAYTDPANPNSQQIQVEQQTVAGRTILGWTWQNDPGEAPKRRLFFVKADPVNQIATRADMARFLDALSQDAVARATECENRNTSDVLESKVGTCTPSLLLSRVAVGKFREDLLPVPWMVVRERAARAARRRFPSRGQRRFGGGGA
jgi:hypothetical protein